MSMLRGMAAALSLSGAVLLCTAGAGFAQNVEGALERLKAMMADQQMEIDWQDADIDGDSATLTGVVAVNSEGERTPLGDIELAGIAETAEGWRIEQLSMPIFAHEEDGTEVTIEGFEVTGLTMPREGRQTSLFPYDSAAVSSVTVAADGTEVFTLSDFWVEASEAGGEATFSGAAESFTVDLSTVDDADTRAMLAQLGYEQLSGRFDMGGSWSKADGRMELAQYDITVTGAGTLGLSLDLGGFTEEMAAAMAAMDPNDDAAGMAVLGMLQQLNLHGMDIAFADDGLTRKSIELIAAQQNMRPSDIVNQAKAILPFMMAQAGLSDLSGMVTDAVSTFLDNPQTLRVSAAPAQPIPFSMLMAGAMASPQQLAQQIGLEVAANE